MSGQPVAARPTGAAPQDGGTTRLQLKIGGMACSFCAASITKGLGGMPGVERAHVSLAHEEAVIEYRAAVISEAELKQVLQDLGYTIRDPRKVKAFEEQQREIDLERRRLIAAGGFTGLSLIFMALMWFHLGPVATLRPVMAVAMPAIALATVFGPGFYILRMAYHSLRRGILNQHVLLEFGAFSGLVGGGLGLVGQYVGVAVLRFPAPDFFAVATFITTYHILSGYASLLVRTKASRSVQKLLSLQPALAHVIRDGTEYEVPVEGVQRGEHVHIRPGEAIPLDGYVVDGRSDVNQSMVTGESLPVGKELGDEVIGGAMNLTGRLVIEVTRVGEEGFLQQVARQIEDARAKKPALLQLVDRVLAAYVPIVLGFAGLAVLIWTAGAYAVTGHVDITRGIFAMLAVFVMGYPCALGMATPLAMIRGGGLAAERGILIRGGEAYQVLKDIRRVVLDKTGTLTRGEPAVTGVMACNGYNDSAVLAAAAAAEAASEHPLAAAVVQAAEARGLPLAETSDFRAMPGKGVTAIRGGRHLLVGSPRFLADEGVDLSSHDSALAAWQDQGNTVVGVADEGRLMGLIAIADTLKPDAIHAVRSLRALGIEPVMITGDNQRTARAVAQEVGITEFRAEVLPEGKAEEVRRLQGSGYRVMMVGDGINDAPALAQADVGVAIGAGTDIAIEAADIVLLGERLTAVADTVVIGRTAYRKTVQNITLAFAFNGVGVPLALTGLVSPAWAMLAMVASVSTVLANSFLGRSTSAASSTVSSALQPRAWFARRLWQR